VLALTRRVDTRSADPKPAIANARENPRTSVGVPLEVRPRMAPRIALLVTFALSLTACGKTVVQQVEALADEACACKDKPCIEGVKQKMDELKKSASKPADADEPALEAAAKRMQQCAMTIELGG
jgi:hypothetical protein